MADRRKRQGYRMRWILVIGLLPMAGAGAVGADTFTVGPTGGYTSLQAAVDAALAIAGPHEIRVAGGTFLGLTRIDTDSLADLYVTGHWDEHFASREGGETVLSALAVPACAREDDPLDCAVLAVRRAKGLVKVDGFTIAGFQQRGVYLDQSAGATAVFSNNVVRDCRPPEVAGRAVAALWARVEDSSLHLFANRITGNGVSSFDVSQVLVPAGEHPSVVQVRANDISDNVGESALRVYFRDSGGPWPVPAHDVELSDNAFRHNEGYAALDVQCWFGKPIIDAFRNVFDDNQVWSQFLFYAEDAATPCAESLLRISDTQITRGLSFGLTLSAYNGIGLHADVTNVTIADHPWHALFINAGVFGEGVHVTNSIFARSGKSNVVGRPWAGDSHANFTSGDPVFIDPEHGDYQLSNLSPLIDAGDDAAREGLGTTDVLGHSRIQGANVDVGAVELNDDEPACRLLDVAGRETGLCRCVSDDGLLEARCSGELPGLHLDLRVPLRWEPFEPFRGDLTILPANPVEGLYGLEFSTVMGGITTEQPWLGPVAPYLKPAEAVIEPFKATLPMSAPALFRAALKFERAGLSDRVILEAQIGKPPTK